MHELVVGFLLLEFLAGGSEVSVIVEVGRDLGSCNKQYEASDIKLSTMEQCRVDVLLNYICAVGLLVRLFL